MQLNPGDKANFSGGLGQLSNGVVLETYQGLQQDRLTAKFGTIKVNADASCFEKNEREKDE